MLTPENYKSLLTNNNEALKIHILKHGLENVEPGWVTKLIDDLRDAKNSKEYQKTLAENHDGKVNLLLSYNRRLTESINEYKFFMWFFLVLMIISVGGSLIYNIVH